MWASTKEAVTTKVIKVAGCLEVPRKQWCAYVGKYQGSRGLASFLVLFFVSPFPCLPRMHAIKYSVKPAGFLNCCLALRILSYFLCCFLASFWSFFAAFSFSSKCRIRSVICSASWFINDVANTKVFLQKGPWCLWWAKMVYHHCVPAVSELLSPRFDRRGRDTELIGLAQAEQKISLVQNLA